MGRFAEDAAARIVRSLSASFKKKLTIVDSASADAARSFALTAATCELHACAGGANTIPRMSGRFASSIVAHVCTRCLSSAR